MSELVSILIPVYNREGIISETLDSALAQTYRNIEVIVVDNASTDGTWSIIQTYAERDQRIRAFRNDANLGPVRNWQRAIDEAKGKYGKILWSDDLVAPDFIEKTLPYLIDDDDVGFVFTSVKIFTDEPDNGILYHSIGVTGVYLSEEFVRGDIDERGYPVSPGCALFRLKDLRVNLIKDIPNKIGSDFSMHAIGGDLLIYLLTAKQYYKFAFVSDVLSFFRSHEGSISVSSKNCKLPLHYNIARAYFVETYRPDLARLLNEKLFLFLCRYRDSSEYGVSAIKDFYRSRVDCSFSWLGLILFLVRKFLRRKGLAKKIF